MSRLLAALSVLLVLGGCGGDPPPSAPPGPTSTPTPTADAAPVMPELAKEDSKAGAEAFVRHYVEVLNSASDSGETDSLRALHLTSCDACNAVAELIDRTYDLGGRIEGNGWRILSVRFFRDPAATNEALVNTVASVADQRVYPATDHEPKLYDGNARRELLWGLRHTDAQWRITSLQTLP